MSPRPVPAFVLGLIGGIFTLISGAISLLVFPWWWWGGTLFLVFSILTLVCGILVIVGSSAMLARPAHHTAWGIVVLVFSLVSIVGILTSSVLGIVGVVLGAVGGGIGIAWRPYGWYGGPYGMQPMAYPMWASTFPGPAPASPVACPRCGAGLVPGAPFCARCGTRL